MAHPVLTEAIVIKNGIVITEGRVDGQVLFRCRHCGTQWSHSAAALPGLPVISNRYLRCPADCQLHNAVA